MMENQFDGAYAATQLARRESLLRKFVKDFYLKRVTDRISGPTLDIGCGAGQLLERLPDRSKGLEINPVLVNQLRRRGLDVEQVCPQAGAISLGTVEAGRFTTAVLSHVLEHFDDAATVLERLIADCRRLRIARLIVVVPGAVGYRSDRTHKTFVTAAYLRDAGLLDPARFGEIDHSYFPGNTERIGKWFVYHELMIVYRF